VGLWAAGFGFFNLLLRGWRLPPARFVLFLPLVPAASFVLFFGLVFTLAYAFPPSSEELSGGMSFRGARWVVWPVIGLLTLATFYLVLRGR
jgi:hypothetical protein